MSSVTTSYYDTLVSTETTTTTSSSSTDLTAEDFLTLLVTELEYQDPTEPLDNTEMVNQLTQYSQLDELTAINDSLDSFAESIDAMNSTSGLEYLGKEVESSGYSVALSDGEASTLYYDLEDDAAEVTFNIYNSSGTLVDTVTYSNMEAGSGSFVWDGTDSDGDTCSDGTYSILVSAEDSDGADVDVDTTTTGTVSGISTTDDGVYLILDDGRTVNILDVTYASS